MWLNLMHVGCYVLPGSQLDRWADIRMVGHECGIATVHSKFRSTSSDWSNITKVTCYISSSQSSLGFEGSWFLFLKWKLSWVRERMNTDGPLPVFLVATSPLHVSPTFFEVGVEWNQFYYYWCHYWPIVLAPNDGWCVWSSLWNEWQGKPKYLKKTCLCGGKPATNRLSYFYFWVLHPVAHLSNWFLMMPSITTKFRYVNSPFIFLLTHYFYHNGSVARTQLDVEMLYVLHRCFDPWCDTPPPLPVVSCILAILLSLYLHSWFIIGVKRAVMCYLSVMGRTANLNARHLSTFFHRSIVAKKILINNWIFAVDV
jgi:hypothetical protein